MHSVAEFVVVATHYYLFLFFILFGISDLGRF